MLLKIVQAGDPVLRRTARDLTAEEIRGPAVRMLIELMRETMRDAPGVGLAAPQIGESIRLAVIEDPATVGDADRNERERQPVPFHVIVNPRLTVVDAGPAEFFEGCLSVDGWTAIVPRARAVRVEALDHQANPITIDAKGWYARILQHEIDHLDGTLYLDRALTRTLCTHDNHGRYYAGHPIPAIKQLLGT